jgi:hypothetical protein
MAAGVQYHNYKDPSHLGLMAFPVKHPNCIHVVDFVTAREMTDIPHIGALRLPQNLQRYARAVVDVTCPTCRAPWTGGNFAAVPNLDQQIQGYVLNRLAHPEAVTVEERDTITDDDVHLYIKQKFAQIQQPQPAANPAPQPDNPARVDVPLPAPVQVVQYRQVQQVEIAAAAARAQARVENIAWERKLLDGIFGFFGSTFTVVFSGVLYCFIAICFTDIDPLSALLFGLISNTFVEIAKAITDQPNAEDSMYASLLSHLAGLAICGLIGCELSLESGLILYLLGMMAYCLTELVVYAIGAGIVVLGGMLIWAIIIMIAMERNY